MKSDADISPEPTPHDAAHAGVLRRLWGMVTDTATYGLSSVITYVVQFLLLPLYTRYLKPEENGVIALLAIVMLLFGPLANFGMTNAIYRRFNQATDDSTKRTVLSTGLMSVLCGSLISLLILQLCAVWISSDFIGDAATTNLVRLCLLSAAINTVAQVPTIALRARRRVRVVAGMNLASVIVSIGTTLWFVVALEWGTAGWVYGTLAADVAALALALLATRGQFDLRFSREMWRSMLSYGLPLVPHRLQAIGLAQFSQIMVSKMLGLDEAGVYAIAAKLALPVGVVVNAIQEAWVPFKFQMHAEEADSRPLFRSMFTYYFAVISYLWVGVSLWGFDVARLMTGPGYEAAAYLVPALALLRVTQGVYFMMGTGMELTDRTGAYPLVSLAGLITVVAGAYLLVEPLGAIGAALAGVLCWAVMAAMIFGLAQRRFDIKYDWPTIGCFRSCPSAACWRATACSHGTYGRGWRFTWRFRWPIRCWRCCCWCACPRSGRTYTCCSENCGPCVA